MGSFDWMDICILGLPHNGRLQSLLRGEEGTLSRSVVYSTRKRSLLESLKIDVNLLLLLAPFSLGLPQGNDGESGISDRI